MDVSVSGTIDQKTYLKNLGGFSPLSLSLDRPMVSDTGDVFPSLFQAGGT